MAKTDTRFVYVFAHGAGAGMNHPFMQRAAEALGARGIATHRFNFPYMDAKKSRPDPPAVAEEAVRKAVAEAARAHPGVRILAGGKSFGGRMTSQAQASQPMPGVRGLVFFGFPLHPPGKPGTNRADHLTAVDVPMLFLQGTRDEFAQPDLLRKVIDGLGDRASLHLIDDGDHSFKVPKRTGKTETDVMNELADTILKWTDNV
ncbi:MAG TPA: alpha/beta family hydrolase [Gemmatimonadales bacterium]|nr:alpha/beta family hydrolase [Gemmatimonadales bacterium]